MESGTVSKSVYAGVAKSFGRALVGAETGEIVAGVRPAKTVALVAAFLVSLGLWAAIWTAVASFW